MTIYLVYARYEEDGATTVVMAFERLKDAQEHVARALRPIPHEHDQCSTPSPAELLGIADVYLRPMQVQRGRGSSS